MPNASNTGNAELTAMPNAKRPECHITGIPNIGNAERELIFV